VDISLLFLALVLRSRRQAVYHDGLMFARREMVECAPLALLVALAPLLTTACVRPTAVERAMSLSRQQHDPEAIVVLRQNLAGHPDDLDARRLLIRLLAATSNLPAARDEVQALADRLPPGDPSPFIELGHAFELTHQFDDALAAYEHASEVAPASPAGPREVGLRAAHWGEWELAKASLEEAVKRGANTEDVWHALGLVRLNLHDLEGARDAYTRGAAVDPKSVDSWLGLATVALAGHDWDGALKAYDAVLARRPAWGDGELGRAWALERLGRRAESQRALDRAEDLGADPKALAKQRSLLAADAGIAPHVP
jgi:tetratricopeptide (TPR) repeat protein